MPESEGDVSSVGKRESPDRKIVEKRLWDPAGSTVEQLPNEIILGRGHPAIMQSQHWHAQIEINYARRGSVFYEMHGFPMEIPEGHMAVFWGGLPHRLSDCAADGEMEAIHLPLLQFFRLRLPDSLREALMRGGALITKAPHAEDHLAFARWADYFRSGDPAARIIATEEMLLRIERLVLAPYEVRCPPAAGESASEAPDQPSFDRIGSMLEFMSRHFKDEIDASSIASSAQIHPKYAMSVFRKSTGMTLNQYVLLLRLSYAQALLMQGEDSIVDIAMDSGFGSLSHFNRVFRKHTGASPSDFRRAHGSRLQTSA
ncbi:helix-turn-helix domain-containing protein [Pseudoruegeria sp. SHC-113]|uniref:helix-turn-helix domain-containing protein n=1 Tax=Pseudoruegeria sp. SHC-113 TaxID=2855439 RepID=UPI0021BB89ED|nr:helix-turn-helix domain-containing protein [Pseudoruegeria sp. SHC-113]MCT8162149.1 helix-turn-helix domain-containing protein [Pseudoruegeria sp. SHC-113]